MGIRGDFGVLTPGEESDRYTILLEIQGSMQKDVEQDGEVALNGQALM